MNKIKKRKNTTKITKEKKKKSKMKKRNHMSVFGHRICVKIDFSLYH